MAGATEGVALALAAAASLSPALALRLPRDRRPHSRFKTLPVSSLTSLVTHHLNYITHYNCSRTACSQPSICGKQPARYTSNLQNVLHSQFTCHLVEVAVWNYRWEAHLRSSLQLLPVDNLCWIRSDSLASNYHSVISFWNVFCFFI